MRLHFEKQWDEGVRGVTCAFSAFTEQEMQRLRRLASSMMEQKEAMQAVVARVDAGSHCAGCGGACCVSGKYHFTGVDLLVYLVTGKALFAPLFGNGLCPYLAEEGCLMAPAYRPFNCITFNCEVIEDLLSKDEVSRFYQLERELRRSYGEIRSLFAENAMGAALLKGDPAPL